MASAASRLVAQGAPGVTWSSPAWSRDGRHLALREMGFFVTKGDVQNVLAVVEVDTGRIQYPLGRTKRQVFTPEWAPDGLRLAVPYSPHDCIHPFRLACGVVAAGSGDVACLASDYFIAPFHSLCWHPDNRTIFCCSACGITTQVVRVDTATGSVRPVTNAPGVHEHLRCSADGTRLVCTYRTLTTVPEVYLLSADGRVRRQVTQVGDRGDLAQQVIGRHTVLQAERIQALWRKGLLSHHGVGPSAGILPLPPALSPAAEGAGANGRRCAPAMG